MRTASIEMREERGQLIVTGPFIEMREVFPKLKSRGFKYNSSDKSWRIEKSQLTARKLKNLDKLLDNSRNETLVQMASAKDVLDKLDGLQFFRVEYNGKKGFAIHGNVFDFKEIVKKAGGRWNRGASRYDFEYYNFDVDKLELVVDKILKAEKDSKRLRSEIRGKLDNKDFGIVSTHLRDSYLYIMSTSKKYRDIIKQHFPKARWKLPYWMIKVSDIEYTNVDKFIKKVNELEESSFQDKSKPKKDKKRSTSADYSWSVGEGYGGKSYKRGTVVVAPLSDQKKGWPKYLYILKTESTYFREDGMSFGVGDDSGKLFYYSARAATPEEAQPLIDESTERASKSKALKELKDIGLDIRKKGRCPKVMVKPKGNKYVLNSNLIPYGGGSWFVVDSGVVWYVVNNGSDGDNWDLNNVQTGGAGAIGHRIRDRFIAQRVEYLAGIMGIKPSK